MRFLQDLRLQSLSATESTVLGTPISLAELKEAHQSMSKGKSLDIDGIPPEFFLTTCTQLGPLLLDMIQTAIEKGSFHRDVNTAVISLLLKKDKDPILFVSYRHLSLIYHDQTGFIKTRLASDNVRHLLHIIQATADSDAPCAVFSLDAELAFNRLEWDYLWSVLDHLGLGSEFTSMI